MHVTFALCLLNRKSTYHSLKIIKFWNLLTVRLNKIICTCYLFSCPPLQRQTQLPDQICNPTPVQCTFSKNKYGKESVKYKCIGDWNNFKKKFPQIPENKLSKTKIKRILKQAIFDQYWTFYSPRSTSTLAPCIIFTFYLQGLFNWHHTSWFYWCWYSLLIKTLSCWIDTVFYCY